MIAAELLAQLTASERSYEPQSPSISDLTEEDLKFALSFIEHQGERNLVLYKYCDDYNVKGELVNLIWHRMDEFFFDKKWKIDPYFLHKLCRLAVDDVINDHVCPVCGGRGAEMIENCLYICSGCNGIGKRPPNPEWYARQLGINYKMWKENIGYKYREITATLRGWETNALSAIKNALD